MHRLVASKTDGKMVQFECEGDICQDEKIDALQLEVSNFFKCLITQCGYRGFPNKLCSSAVLVPADQSAGFSKDLLGEQDCSSGERDSRRGKQLSFTGPGSEVLILTVFCLSVIQITNMKAKFKETLERCDNLEQRLGEISKEKQSLEKKYVLFLHGGGLGCNQSLCI